MQPGEQAPSNSTSSNDQVEEADDSLTSPGARPRAASNSQDTDDDDEDQPQMSLGFLFFLCVLGLWVWTGIIELARWLIR